MVEADGCLTERGGLSVRRFFSQALREHRHDLNRKSEDKEKKRRSQKMGSDCLISRYFHFVPFV